MVVAGVVVQSPSIWFLVALVAFTCLVIGAAPWLLGS
jgi:hypothetical protein